MATTFTRVNVGTIGQELQEAIAAVLAKHGLVAARRGKFTHSTYDVTFTLTDANPDNKASDYLGRPVEMTTEKLQRGEYFGNNLVAMVRDSTGQQQVRITKRAVKNYQFMYLTGPNKGRPFAGPFRMFSAVPVPVEASEAVEV
jgi:hypothetical protein